MMDFIAIVIILSFFSAVGVMVFVAARPATSFSERFEAELRKAGEPAADGVVADPRKQRGKQMAETSDESEPAGFPVSLVGEQHYTATVDQLNVGDTVILWIERGNPYDDKALAMTDARGRTIGYVPKDSFLRRAVHKECKGFTGTVLNLHQGERGFRQVTVDVVLHPKHEEAVPFREFGSSR